MDVSKTAHVTVFDPMFSEPPYRKIVPALVRSSCRAQIPAVSNSRDPGKVCPALVIVCAVVAVKVRRTAPLIDMPELKVRLPEIDIALIALPHWPV